MEMSHDERDYILSLHGQKLSDAQVEEVFAFIAMLDEGESAHPRSLKGKRLAVETYINLVWLHAHRTEGGSPHAP